MVSLDHNELNNQWILHWMIDCYFVRISMIKNLLRMYIFLPVQKLNEEALAQATMQYNIQLGQLRTDNAVLSSNMEKEKGAKEKYEVEVGNHL